MTRLLHLIPAFLMAIQPAFATAASQPIGIKAAAFESAVSEFIAQAKEFAITPIIEAHYPAPTSTSTSTYFEPVRAQVNQVALKAWSGTSDGNLGDSIKEAVQPALDLLAPVIDYIVKNPWVLIPLVVPIMNLWLAMIGFEAGGVVAGSLAAAINSYIGNVSSGSLFAFLQSNGAAGFARVAVRMAGAWLLVAVLLASVGKILIERGLKNDDVAGFLGQVWNMNLALPTTAVGLPAVTGTPVEGSAGQSSGGSVLGLLAAAAWAAWGGVYAGL